MTKLIPLLFLTLLGSSLAQTMGYKILRYQRDYRVLQNFYNTAISETGHERMVTFYEDWRKQLDGMNFDALSRDDQVDWILLDSHLRSQLAAFGEKAKRNSIYADYLQFTDGVTALDGKRRAREPVDEAAHAVEVAKIREAVKASRKAMEKRQNPPEKKKEGEEKEREDKEEEEKEPEPPAKLAKWQLFEIASKTKAAERMLNDWYNHYAKYRPGFDWWLAKPVEGTKKELQEYDKWLREKMAGIKNRDEAPPFGEVVGEERLQEQLDYEFIPYTPAELIQKAEEEFAWCVKEMEKASKELGFDDRKKGLEYIKNQFVPPGQQEEYVTQQAMEAMRFCDKRKLVTIPQLCREAWRVQMVDENRQKMLPYAAYGGLNVMVAYATGNMDHEAKLMSMRGNNKHTTRIVTAHEVIPGHHLQGFVGQRHRAYRSQFRTPFYIEGWALYWEMRLWELGFTRGPEDRIGFLFWRMHRCARIIVTLKFHTGQMEPKKMIDFLVDEVGHERAQATAEVRRYIKGGYSPLYQAAYMLGGMQLRSLHKTLVEEGDLTEKQFHDTVLRLGTIPVEMVRASMVEDVELSKDYRTNWKF